ncbi:hypothetical protein A2U01_0047327, partial [Trifolium medium]|nr:hypothetical protein [Trifolium medium]
SNQAEKKRRFGIFRKSLSKPKHQVDLFFNYASFADRTREEIAERFPSCFSIISTYLLPSEISLMRKYAEFRRQPRHLVIESEDIKCLNEERLDLEWLDEECLDEEFSECSDEDLFAYLR